MMDIPIQMAVKFFGVSCAVVFLGEAIPTPTPEFTTIAELGKLSLVGVLSFSSVVLWKAFMAEKEARIREVTAEKDARIKQAEEFTSFLKSIHQQREMEIKERDHG